jgi:hypothetical protein
MSYKKAMKWAANNRKGVSYKRGYLGFNPSGITSEQIKEREAKYIAELKAAGEAAIQAEREKILEMREEWRGSWPWEWCAFSRHFSINPVNK